MPDKWDTPPGQTQHYCACERPDIRPPCCRLCGMDVEPKPATMRRLTEGEIREIWNRMIDGETFAIRFTRAIESALAKKNGMLVEDQ